MTDYRAIMTGVAVVCALAALCAVWPTLDAILCTLVIGTAVITAGAYWAREAVRELRFRRDMRALDARDAAWAAQRGTRTEVPA